MSSGNVYEIKTPYVVYCGDQTSKTSLKVACGVIEWVPEKVVAVTNDSNRLFPDMQNVSLDEAVKLGAATLVIGFAPFGGKLTDAIVDVAIEALNSGLDVASGLHDKLADNKFVQHAMAYTGKNVFDFRHRPDVYPLGTGKPRTGIRLLTVGTDCICGKKFTSLSLHRRFLQKNLKSVFCSTGQTGFLISGCGINNDTITADFLSGAAESLSPDADSDTLYVIEGQGSIEHPAYTGGSMSLIAGSQPDFLVVCHAHGRTHRLGLEESPIDLVASIFNNLNAAAIHGYNPVIAGVSINFSNTPDVNREEALAEYAKQLSYYFDLEGVPVFDPSMPDGDINLVVDYFDKYVEAHNEKA